VHKGGQKGLEGVVEMFLRLNEPLRIRYLFGFPRLTAPWAMADASTVAVLAWALPRFNIPQGCL
jgi:hypothetical protein